ncbi:MauE/DoxX family redox-associated membrane protein [Nonomuraea sp. SYSU D8015]|uniref:MauE/DoxX family redox-associated membrane protein n=1 Tax=Nonomuraea sp. SYSU D8015 TaxID=2593644 RepID=UPI001660AB63|nr:MauE/DoxX family redox-associated membrane protein [Nonomuraea sp. SYSU D8015]
MDLADLAGAGCGLLAALFVASGVPKIRRPFGLALALVRFGVVGRVRPGLGRLLGVLEVAAGLAVAVSPVLLPAATCALVLLVAFTAVVVRSLLAGQSVECACFGTGETTSWATVARNLVLIGVAAFVAAAPVAPTIDQRISGLLIGTVVTCGYLLISTMAVLKPFSVRLDG